MKNYPILIIFLVLALFSCKKNNTSNLNTNVVMNNKSDSVTADIDGTHYIFNNSAIGQTIFIAQSNYTEFTLFVREGIDTTSNLQLVFISEAGHPIETKTYTNDLAIDSSDATIVFQLPHNSQEYSTLQGSSHLVTPFTITVTAVTDSSVDGTFQGPIYLSGMSGSPSMNVTNGKFHASH